MKVLLAIDASQASQYVLSEAAARPWPSGTIFCVMHVVDLAGFARVPALLEAEKQAARAMVKAAAEKLARAGFEGRTDVLIDFPRRGVVEYAKEWGADLIVLGSHGWRGIDRLVMGSVSESIALHAKCSVEIIRP